MTVIDKMATVAAGAATATASTVLMLMHQLVMMMMQVMSQRWGRSIRVVLIGFSLVRRRSGMHRVICATSQRKSAAPHVQLSGKTNVAPRVHHSRVQPFDRCRHVMMVVMVDGSRRWTGHTTTSARQC